MTRHAQVRCQQRSIPPVICEWLLLFGSEAKSHGTTKRYFDKTARKRLAKAVGAEVVGRMGNLLDHYLVETDAVIVTAGVRTRRIKRN